MKISREFKRSSYREYSFECAANHRFKSWQWDSVTSIACTAARCRRKAYRLLPQQRSSGLQPTVYYTMPDGRTIVPGRSSNRPPAGATVHEIRTFRDRDRFYRVMNQQAAAEHERFMENAARYFGDGVAEGRAELHRYLAQGMVPEKVIRDGVECATGRMAPLTPEGRDLIQHALAQSSAPDRFDPQAHIAAWENDNPSYNDRDTDFRDRRY